MNDHTFYKMSWKFENSVKLNFFNVSGMAGLIEPRYEKAGFQHMRKQRRRSASRLLISAFVFAT